MHQNTFNQACITDASVQKVFKARGQVRLPNTAVTAKLSAPGNPRCVARGDVLGHIPGGGEKDDIMKRGARRLFFRSKEIFSVPARSWV